jgi:hypothetical protein
MGSSGASAPVVKTQAAPITSETPELEIEEEAKTESKKRKGKRGLRIRKSEAINVPSSGSGLNIPTGTN